MNNLLDPIVLALFGLVKSNKLAVAVLSNHIVNDSIKTIIKS